MNTTTPTPEEFLAQTDIDEDELPDPLSSIADSLRQLVGAVVEHDTEEKASDRLREALDDTEAKYAVMAELIEEITVIVKPSTSKLANSVREAISRWSSPGVAPEPVEAPGVEPVPVANAAEMGHQPLAPDAPSEDADVETWRAYARSVSVECAAGESSIDSMNRSQIRTMLGIPHGGQSEGSDGRG